MKIVELFRTAKQITRLEKKIQNARGFIHQTRRSIYALVDKEGDYRFYICIEPEIDLGDGQIIGRLDPYIIDSIREDLILRLEADILEKEADIERFKKQQEGLV